VVDVLEELPPPHDAKTGTSATAAVASHARLVGETGFKGIETSCDTGETLEIRMVGERTARVKAINHAGRPFPTQFIIDRKLLHICCAPFASLLAASHLKT
jgi:hypothetical protein